MSGIEAVNSCIAMGDLAAAGIATLGMRALSGGQGDFFSDFLVMGGSAVIACQVADVVHPRVMKMLKLEHTNEFQALAMDFGFAAASGLVLTAMATGGLSGITQASLAPAAVVGLACVGGRKVSEYLYASKEQSSGSVAPSDQV